MPPLPIKKIIADVRMEIKKGGKKMANIRTAKACQECGAVFYGSEDCHYCPDCAKMKKSDTAIRIRICQDCGAKFFGGPRAKRCPPCADVAAKIARKIRGNSAPARPLGSMDKCKMCGKEYTVKSGRQMYCPDCARAASLAWQRKHKKGYAKKSGQDIKRKERRAAQMKICVYCLKSFKTDSTTNFCSDDCRKAQKQLQACEADIKRGRNRDLQKYIDARQAARDVAAGKND